MANSAAERALEYRRRRKTGAMIVSVNVPPGLLEHLIEGGWLSAWDAADKPAVAAAVENFFVDCLKDIVLPP